MKKPAKQIRIGSFTVAGTSSPSAAATAIRRLLSHNRCGLKYASYRIGGKTITIKPQTR